MISNNDKKEIIIAKVKNGSACLQFRAQETLGLPSWLCKLLIKSACDITEHCFTKTEQEK